MPALVLIIALVVLTTAGVYLLLDRTLTRILLGFLLLGNAINLLIFLMSGTFGQAPIVDATAPTAISDPLPQAFILTAIVITFAICAFVLALIYRTWWLKRDVSDRVEDDPDDLLLANASDLTPGEVTAAGLAETDEQQ